MPGRGWLVHLSEPSLCGPGRAGWDLLTSEDLQGSGKQDDCSWSLRWRGCSMDLGEMWSEAAALCSAEKGKTGRSVRHRLVGPELPPPHQHK